MRECETKYQRQQKQLRTQAKQKKRSKTKRENIEEEKEFEKLLIECHVRQTTSTDGHF